MSRTAARRWAYVCYTLALLLSFLLIRVTLTNSFGYLGDSWEGRGSAESGGLSAAFMIKGDATAPVSPGVAVPIALRFTNPHDEPLKVTHLKVTLRELSTPSADRRHPCSKADFHLTQIERSITIVLPPAATLSLQDLQVPRRDWPRIGMRNRDVNQDGCRGARMKLGYTAFGSLEL